MTTLPIVTYPAKILRQRSREIPEATPETRALAPQMVKTMREANGVGLAGPQVNIPQRIIIVQDKDKAFGFINPKILSRSKEQEEEEEGCLSVPGLFVPLKRAKSVEVECQRAEDGSTVLIHAEGLLARIFQHEIDHLNGILIIDRIGFLRRFKIRSFLRDLAVKSGT
ncbi:MAG: peptide deformylase [Candidatus Yanofskybacteria bacterium]|nr:peptide deformylase [Candidatus Yanofskybacteria bacterium]